MAPQATLTYFDIRGLAELCRIVAAAGKYEIDEVRYPFNVEFKDGAMVPGSMKRAEFEADQAAGKLDASMGKVPFLKVGDTVITQSMSICRYIAGQSGLMGANNVEAGQIDALCECVRDVKDAWGKVRMGTPEEKEKFFNEQLPEMCGKLEKMIQGTGGCAVGSKLSLADVVIYHMLAAPKGAFPNEEAAAKAQGPKLKAICEAVGANAEVKTYLANRKDTPI